MLALEQSTAGTCSTFGSIANIILTLPASKTIDYLVSDQPAGGVPVLVVLSTLQVRSQPSSPPAAPALQEQDGPTRPVPDRASTSVIAQMRPFNAA